MCHYCHAQTTERASKDLEKYYRALDRAIMRYHSIKMREINKIIKELWIKTYKGGDIDTIEIRSEDSKEETVVSLATRRTYNYRVSLWSPKLWNVPHPAVCMIVQFGRPVLKSANSHTLATNLCKEKPFYHLPFRKLFCQWDILQYS